MQTEDFLRGLLQAWRRTSNRGRTHLFLGDPRSDACDKTTVEPGNVYSPGVWTCGISLWFATGGEISSSELLPDEKIRWTFIANPGDTPMVESAYAVGPLSVVHQLAHLGTEGAEGVDFNQIEVRSAYPGSSHCVIVVRDVGPAGGKISAIAWDAATNTLRINKSTLLICEQKPEQVHIAPADQTCDSPSAALSFPFTATSGPFRLSFRTTHGFDEREFAGSVPKLCPYTDLSSKNAFVRAAADWQQALPARVFAPDPRVALAWERCAWHILAAMDNCLPRIGAVNYPVFWIRDCVIVLRALDLLGRHDLARIGNDYLAPMIFSGGFGAESDAPAEGIWSLVRHARATGDWDWCRTLFPLLRTRVEWIERMLTAQEPIRRVTENRLPLAQASPGNSIVCLAAQDGLIHGRMDHHSPDFFINCWAAAGLRFAAEAARHCDDQPAAEAWSRRADEIEDLIATHLLPKYGNDRDPVVTPNPTASLPRHREALARHFTDWYAMNRHTPDGKRKPEPLWTYFEAAQAHNAFLLGLREQAWTTIDGLLAPAGAWDVSAFIEGPPGGSEYLPFGNGNNRRGWLDPKNAFGGNMPHNWTTAEMIACLRDAFVVEDNGTLVLGLGVPQCWMKTGARFGVKDLSTDYGKVSYTIRISERGGAEVDYHGAAPYRLALLG